MIHQRSLEKIQIQKSEIKRARVISEATIKVSNERTVYRTSGPLSPTPQSL